MHALIDDAPAPRARLTRGSAISFGAFLGLTAVALSWAKWLPYWHKLPVVAAGHSLGKSILAGASAPSVPAGVSYCVSYFGSIWPALVAGVVVAAGIEALVPRRWLLTLMASGGSMRRVLIGGTLAAPGLMCTCCAAPSAAALRRCGVPVPAALAYWLGNPSINLAVFAFAAFVLPWQLVALRVASGLALVFLAVPLVSRLVMRGEERLGEMVMAGDLPVDEGSPLAAGRRFLASLGRLLVVLVPEYLVIVFALGALRGLLFPSGPVSGVLIPVFAVAGTLFAIPTAGEVPIVQGLLRSGVGIGPAAALLLTLPAISLPSAVMVGRSFPLRATVAIAGIVVLIGVVDGLAAQALLA